MKQKVAPELHMIAQLEMLADIKKTSAKQFIVQQNNPADLKRFAENSYTSIQGWDW